MDGSWSTVIARKALLCCVKRDVSGRFLGPHPPRQAGRFQGSRTSQQLCARFFNSRYRTLRQDDANRGSAGNPACVFLR